MCYNHSLPTYHISPKCQIPCILSPSLPGCYPVRENSTPSYSFQLPNSGLNDFCTFLLRLFIFFLPLPSLTPLQSFRLMTLFPCSLPLISKKQPERLMPTYPTPTESIIIQVLNKKLPKRPKLYKHHTSRYCLSTSFFLA